MANKLDKTIIVRRLAIVKYLFNIGVQQSYQPEVVAGFSILSFHDSIEMFLQLVAENKGDKSSDNFMSFWDKYSELTLKESIRNLKDRRVNIKHKGLFPSKTDIEVSRVSALNFFEQNTPIQFGINFDEVSLSSLISYDKVRNYIKAAETTINTDFYESLRNSKMAFLELLSTYDNSKYWGVSSSLIDIGDRIGNEYQKLTGNDDKLGRKWFRTISDTTNNLRDILKITALGIDYKKYVFFNLVTPETSFYCTANGMEYHSISREYHEKRFNLRTQDCQFCIDFVIDSSLKLQDFDLDIKSIYNR